VGPNVDRRMFNYILVNMKWKMPKRLKLSINMSQDCHNRGQAFLNPVKLQCHIVKNTLLQTAFVWQPETMQVLFKWRSCDNKIFVECKAWCPFVHSKRLKLCFKNYHLLACIWFDLIRRWSTRHSSSWILDSCSVPKLHL